MRMRKRSWRRRMRERRWNWVTILLYEVKAPGTVWREDWDDFVGGEKRLQKNARVLGGQGRKYLEAAGYSEVVFGTHRLWPAYTFTQRKTEILWEPRRILKGIIFSWRITWASFHPFSGSQRNFQKEGHFEFESIGMENLS
jgi:hypothetical protein